VRLVIDTLSRTLFDVRRVDLRYSLFRSCLACEPMRTRSPTFLMPMSRRWVWSISTRFSPLMWLTGTVSEARFGRHSERTLEQLDIVGAVDTLQPLTDLVLVPVPARSVESTAGKGTAYLTASGAS
jgi:hypothetical protein